jgi:hypothetical protein
VDLIDDVLSLRTLASDGPNRSVCTEADVNGDYRIGAEEAAFVLRSTGGVQAPGSLSTR